MLIEWAESAETDLLEILAYFASIEEKETGQRIVDRLFTATGRLENFPLSGKVGSVPDTREIVLAELPYILVYTIQGDIVQIVNVVHTAREYPSS